MTHLNSAARFIFNLILNRPFASVLLFVLLSGAASGQSTTAVDGYTPLALSPGSPAGSYSLSGFESVNLYNGALNFNLPLVTVSGRGGASHQITRPVENKW
ncbi:MAG TPA: hypothetical protein VD861_14095, partial [Pyrinomonadaceae bacterium]|nr:hypothetical protein [Pyrinomonadaceae bacterium]